MKNDFILMWYIIKNTIKIIFSNFHKNIFHIIKKKKRKPSKQKHLD